ncbi:MAG: serine/threonine-protein kinase [Myxococcota bacterium]
MRRVPGTVYNPPAGGRSAAARGPRANGLEVGDIIGGRYVIEEMLGDGGMAVVYRATNSATGKQCALKILQAQLGDRPEFVQLFAKEARVSAVIGDNDHIVDVVDAGLDEKREIPFIVMELLEGETLEEVLGRGPLDLSLIRELLRQLGAALEQAHRAGVVHRDLKPSNLFISTDRQGKPLLKVMDFGIAKVLEGEAIRTATHIGTPAYNAPEQMGSTTRKLAAKQGIGIAAGVSPATDVWALGLLAYEMFTGDLPGQYWGVETLAELPMKVAFEDHEAASERAGRNAALLPAGFDAWFAKCLRKDATERYPTGGTAIDALFDVLDRREVGADEPGVQVASTRVVYEAPERAVREVDRKGASAPPPLPPASASAIAGAARVDRKDARAAAEAPLSSRGGPEGSAASGEAAERPSAGRGSVGGGGARSAVGQSTGRPVVALRPAEPAAERKSWGIAMAVSLAGLAAAAAFGLGARDGTAPTTATACAPGGDVAPCREACEAGALEACENAADILAVGAAGAERDLTAAQRLYATACGVDSLGANTAPEGRRAWMKATEAAGCDEASCRAQACVALGGLYATGPGDMEKSPLLAGALYKRVCSYGTDGDTPRGVQGCIGLGHQREKAGELVAARNYYNAACAGDLTSGCVALGNVLERGDRRGEGHDEKRARQLYQKACDAGDLAGCTFLGRMVELGKGGWKKDAGQAVTFYKRACDGNLLVGCVKLAEAHRRGRGGLTRDTVRAAELLTSSCDGGEPRACADLVDMMLSEEGGLVRDEKRTFTLSRDACEAGSADACAWHGIMFRDGLAGLQQDDSEARKRFDRACKEGSALGCVWLARSDAASSRLVGRELDRLLETACDDGALQGCNLLGEYAFAGQNGIARDLERAAGLFGRACDGGQMRGCSNLANMHYAGLGGLEKDPSESLRLNRKACEEGNDAVGCTRLGNLFAIGGDGVEQDLAKASELHRRACGKSGRADDPQQRERCRTLKKLIEFEGDVDAALAALEAERPADEPRANAEDADGD